ncbi:MAG: hypothetical protein P8J37_19020 [Fuerstiella sp.]|nr:hypothetical protein [Fuerstiella sp.]
MMNRIFGLSAALAAVVTFTGIAVTIVVASIAAVLSMRILMFVGSEVPGLNPPPNQECDSMPEALRPQKRWGR